MSAQYHPHQPPPPGQGYYSGQPGQQYEPPRHRRSQDESISPRSTPDHFASREPPEDLRDPRSRAYDPRRGSEAPPEDFEPPNQLAPYDEEKAFAEWNRAYGPQPAYVPSNAPSIQSERHARRRSLDDRRRRYEEELDAYDDISVDRHSRPRRRHRRHDSTQSVSDSRGKPETKDLGPTLMASAAGAFLGRKMVSKGALGIVGGAIAGAIGANAGEHLDDRKRRRDKRRDETRRDDDDRYYRERDDGRHRGVRTRPHREEMRDTETLPPRRRHPRDLSRTPRRKRYVGSSPDSYMSV